MSLDGELVESRFTLDQAYDRLSEHISWRGDNGEEQLPDKLREELRRLLAVAWDDGWNHAHPVVSQ